MAPVRLSVGAYKAFGMAHRLCVTAEEPRRLEFNRLLTSLLIFHSEVDSSVG